MSNLVALATLPGTAFGFAGMMGAFNAIMKHDQIKADFKERIDEALKAPKYDEKKVESIKEQYGKSMKSNWMMPSGLLVVAAGAFLFPPLLGAMGVAGIAGIVVGLAIAAVAGVAVGKQVGESVYESTKKDANSYVEQELEKRKQNQETKEKKSK